MAIQIYDYHEVKQHFATVLEAHPAKSALINEEFDKLLRNYIRTNYTEVNRGLQRGMYVANQDYAAMQPPIGEL